MIFKTILLGFILTYFDVFEKVLLRPTIFIISKEKYLFIGGRPMSECSMTRQSDECFGCLQFVNKFLYNLLTCCTNLILLQILYTYVLLSLEGCTTGLISVVYLHFCSLGLLGGYLACLCSFIMVWLSCFLELF